MLPHFTIAYWCVFFVAAMLPLLCSVVAKRGLWQEALTGRVRQPRSAGMAGTADGCFGTCQCSAGQQFRGTAFFIAAVLVAHQLGAGQAVLDLLAVLYVLLRLFYIMMYVSDMPRARSAVWAGLSCQHCHLLSRVSLIRYGVAGAERTVRSTRTGSP